MYVAPTCTISVNPGGVQQGSSATLSWSSAGTVTSFHISSVGYVTPNTSGSTSVAPSQTTTYNGSVSGPGGQSTCQANLTVTVPVQCPATCPEGYTMSNNLCLQNSCTNTTTCPAGYHLSGNLCIQNTVTSCPSGYTLQNGMCLQNTCTQNNCPSAYYCEDANTSCLGNAAASCSRTCRVCPAGCSGGVCNPVPEASGTITALPTLVSSGSTANITWSTNGMVSGSCRVTEDSSPIQDVWDGNSSNAAACTHSGSACVTSALTQKTRYTLSCTETSGEDFSAYTTVNIAPTWHEN